MTQTQSDMPPPSGVNEDHPAAGVTDVARGVARAPGTTRTLAQRLNLCMKEADYLQKDLDVDKGRGGKFKGISHDKVSGAVRGLFAKHGIVFLPSVVNHSIVRIAGFDGKERDHFIVDMLMVICSSDDREDRMESRWSDMGPPDANGIIVATSLNTKRFLLKLLLLKTGEEEESKFGSPNGGGDPPPANTEPNQSVTDQQKKEFAQRMLRVRESHLANLGITEYAEYAAWLPAVVNAVTGLQTVRLHSELAEIAGAIEKGEIDWVTGNKIQPPGEEAQGHPPEESQEPPAGRQTGESLF